MVHVCVNAAGVHRWQHLGKCVDDRLHCNHPAQDRKSQVSPEPLLYRPLTRHRLSPGSDSMNESPSPKVEMFPVESRFATDPRTRLNERNLSSIRCPLKLQVIR